MTEPIENYFVCVGAQKAGTTWLARILAQHPDLFVTPVKEVHYFDHMRGITSHLSDKKRRSRYRKYLQKLATQWNNFDTLKNQWAWYRDYMKSPLNDDWYTSLFRHRRAAKFAGEATPEYAIIGEDGFRHIKRLAPDARVIYIMRNPVDRTWSHILHAHRALKKNVRNSSVDDLIDLSNQERFQKLSDYLSVIEGLRTVFSPDQIKLVFYEDVHKDRKTALEDICAFIGTNKGFENLDNLGARFNVSQNAMMPDQVGDHLTDKFQPMVETLIERLGYVPQSWR